LRQKSGASDRDRQSSRHRVDLPDNVTAAGLSLITNAGGAVTVSVTVLLTPEEMDAAAQLSPDYRPPGN